MKEYELIIEQDLQDEGYFKNILPEWFGQEEEKAIIEEGQLPDIPESLQERDALLDEQITEAYVQERTMCPCQECCFEGKCKGEYDEDFLDDLCIYTQSAEEEEDEDHERDWEFIRDMLSLYDDILDDAYDWARSEEEGWYYPD